MSVLTLTQGWPWNDLDDVDYILNTYGNDPYYFKIPVSSQELLDHGFDPAHKTVFVAHGWVKSGETYCEEFKDGKFNSGFEY